MPVNSNKPERWKDDIAASVDCFNEWFMRFAPTTFRESRKRAIADVKDALRDTNDLLALSPATLKAHPRVLFSLRMSTAPPIARDRLIGLAYANKNLVGKMEDDGVLPSRMQPADLDANLGRICDILSRLLDVDIFPWIAAKRSPSDDQRTRAATIVADRLSGALADPTIRNAQEQRQLRIIGELLDGRGYKKKAHPSSQPLTAMEPGTYFFRMNVVVRSNEAAQPVNIPVDAVVQPKKPRPDRLPLLIEAKSAGDFTNVNKRRKEEAKKMDQLRRTFGPKVPYILFLCGYFDSGYLGYEAAEGIDWVWEHRTEDLLAFGL